MSRNSIITAVENNDEVYLLWKKNKIHDATVLHVDAHLDYRDDPGIHIGNYLKQAINDQLVSTVYWIIPGDRSQYEKEVPDIRNKLKSAGIRTEIINTQDGIKTTIGKASLIVCPIEMMPKAIQEPYVIDIDLDFMFFSSCLSADRTKHIGKRKPWISSKKLANRLKPYLQNATMTTLCYSTTGGWTPMRYRHFGDLVMRDMGHRTEDIDQHIIAGTFFESFSSHFEKNELSQARKYYQSALSLNPRYLNFYVTNAPLFLLKGDVKTASKEFHRLRQIDPKNIYGILGSGLVHLLSGQLTEAKRQFEMARELTSNKEIVLFLIYIQSQLGEQEKVAQLLKEYRKNTFPQKPLPSKTRNGLLTEISTKLQKEDENKNIGHMYLYPNPEAVAVWEKLAKYSPNNIGNWTEESATLRHTSAALELDLIEKMADLYFDSPDEYGGYMTSGATEGNIFSAWIGRKYLETKSGNEKIVLISNDLTHYSIPKAADIVGVEVKKTPVNTRDWNVDAKKLLQTISECKKTGITKFLIPLTLGYTIGGTNDAVKEIIQGIKDLKIDYFIWIDAALSGLTMPFLDGKYRSFFPKEIQTVIVDFHKVLGVPMPAGIILYKKDLSTYVKRTVPYLSISDSTLLGTRSGVAPISAWMSIHELGFENFSKKLKKEVTRKNEVLTKIKKNIPSIKIHTDPHALHAAIEVEQELPSSIIQRYGLHLREYNINGKTRLIYPFFFLPQWC